MAKRIGKNNNYKLGLNTFKMMRRYLKSGDLKSYSLAMASLLASAEFMRGVEEEGL